MIRANVDITKTLTSLENQRQKFGRQAAAAVRRTAKSLVRRIVEKTNEDAPGPPVLYYTRTGKLMGGWSPAASFLGVTTPNATGGDGQFTFIETDSLIEFRAINNVRYASAVDIAGPWTTPRGPLPGNRRVRAGHARGYQIVAEASAETKDDLAENIRLAWSAS